MSDAPREQPQEELVWDGIEERSRRRGPLLALLALGVALALLALFIPGLLPRPQTGWGSGFLVDPGHVVTCAHVIEDAGRVSVELDGRWHTVSVTAVSRERDLALLALDAPTDRQGIALGRPPALAVGDDVVAVGFSAGIPLAVVAAGRVQRVGQNLFTPEGHVLYGLVVVSAAFRGGMSGSPLLDMRGRVVGVVGGTLASSSEEPLGYAIGIASLRTWLGRFELDLDTAAPVPLSGPEDAASAARDVLVRVEARRTP